MRISAETLTERFWNCILQAGSTQLQYVREFLSFGFQRGCKAVCGSNELVEFPINDNVFGRWDNVVT